ncbi:MAG: hypothetical protein IKH13_07535, partial [Clostridia bacterium]|nr:hypothetical protein [Clostridia bacterium]
IFRKHLKQLIAGCYRVGFIKTAKTDVSLPRLQLDLQSRPFFLFRKNKAPVLTGKRKRFQ